jgi:hypothetical protein
MTAPRRLRGGVAAGAGMQYPMILAALLAVAGCAAPSPECGPLYSQDGRTVVACGTGRSDPAAADSAELRRIDREVQAIRQKVAPVPNR